MSYPRDVVALRHGRVDDEAMRFSSPGRAVEQPATRPLALAA